MHFIPDYHLWRDAIFLSQPRATVKLLISAGNARWWGGGFWRGVRVLPRYRWSVRRQTLLEGWDALRGLIMQRLGSCHGRAMGLHRDQVRHLKGELWDQCFWQHIRLSKDRTGGQEVPEALPGGAWEASGPALCLHYWRTLSGEAGRGRKYGWPLCAGEPESSGGSAWSVPQPDRQRGS